MISKSIKSLSSSPIKNGDRIMQQNAESTVYYLYDREDRIADYDINGNLIQSYTHGPGIDEPVALTIGTSTYYYIPDIQGSIRAIISADNGSLMASYVYDAWGNLVSYGGPMAKQNDYLYTGREYDWETGIYYYRYRYYNPELGRFLQSSWEHTKEMNMYVYVGNDPVNNKDPTGHPFTPPVLPDHGGGGNPGGLGSCHDYCFTCCKEYTWDLSKGGCYADCINYCLRGSGNGGVCYEDVRANIVKGEVIKQAGTVFHTNPKMATFMPLIPQYILSKSERSNIKYMEMIL